jgi:hypothetical protein
MIIIIVFYKFLSLRKEKIAKLIESFKLKKLFRIRVMF